MFKEIIIWCKNNSGNLWIDIIDLCNLNQGFVSALLTIFTIMISALALITSIQISKMPYRSKLSVIPGYYELNGVPTMQLLLVNYGLSTLVIEYIAIKDKRNSWVGGVPINKPIVLKPSEYSEFEITISDYNGLIQKHALDLNNNMTIEVKEFNGHVLKFKKGFPVG